MKPKSTDEATALRGDAAIEADRSRHAMREQELVANAKMQSAASKLAVLLGKDIAHNNELDRGVFSVVTELVELAMNSGAVTFKDAARFVLAHITQATGEDAADVVHIDMLQGVYIAVSGRYKEQGVTPKTEVLEVESVEELAAEEDDWETEELAEMEATYQRWARPLSRCYMELGSIPRECDPD